MTVTAYCGNMDKLPETDSAPLTQNKEGKRHGSDYEKPRKKVKKVLDKLGRIC